MPGLIGYRPSTNIRRALFRTPAVRNETRRTAAAVRDAARRDAPRKTGAGARSIKVTAHRSGDRPEFRVTWDADHFYMRFHELGTRKMRARPFLRPAARAVAARNTRATIA